MTAIDIWDDPILSKLLPFVRADIRYCKQDVYDLTERFGVFDLVLCGWVLAHLADPLNAVRRLRAVCRDRAIIATSCPADSASDPRPLCEFAGQVAAGGSYWAYWKLSTEAPVRMCRAAGFAGIAAVEHFTLVSGPGAAATDVEPHVVVVTTA